MNDDLSSRPDLLIAMVSGDAIVLGKLVRTLCPHRVLLFATAHAAARGWMGTAQRFLLELTRLRPEMIDTFEVVELAEEGLPAKLTSFRDKIAGQCRLIEKPGARLAFDCTMGQSIFHVMGFDWLRDIAVSNRMDAVAVYCDADTGTILHSARGRDGFVHVSQAISFRYAPGQELVERFEVFDVTPKGGTRLWPRIDLEAGESSEDADPLCQLYDALLEQPALRTLFHSYRNKVRSWKQSRQVRQDYPADAFMRLAKIKVAAGVSGLADVPQGDQGRHAISKALLAGLRAFVGAGNETRHWLEKYLQNRKLPELASLLRQRVNQLPSRLAPGRRQGPDRHELSRQLSGLCSNLVEDLRGELEAIALAAGQEPEHFTAADYAGWLAEELDAIPVLPPVRDRVLAAADRIPDLFEACVGQAMARLAAGERGQPVAAVFQNLSLRKGERFVAELDTLILFRDGNIAVGEVKTHKANADHKKIEANIKQIRDFGGAYSTYCLIYPLTAAELAALADDRQEELDKLRALGMEDLAAWREYVLGVKHSRDQRILGLDQLAALLRARGEG